MPEVQGNEDVAILLIYFELMDTKEKPVKIVDAEGSVRDESNEIDVLRKEFEKNGIGFDRRWGLRTLQDEYKKDRKRGENKWQVRYR